MVVVAGEDANGVVVWQCWRLGGLRKREVSATNAAQLASMYCVVVSNSVLYRKQARGFEGNASRFINRGEDFRQP